MTFGAENFGKAPAVLLTEGIRNLHLDPLLTLFSTTYGRLGELITLISNPEHLREKVKKVWHEECHSFMAKMRDLRHTLIQYLMQRNRFGAGEEKKIEREGDERSNGGGMSLLADLRIAMRIDPLALIRGVRNPVIQESGHPHESHSSMGRECTQLVRTECTAWSDEQRSVVWENSRARHDCGEFQYSLQQLNGWGGQRAK